MLSCHLLLTKDTGDKGSMTIAFFEDLAFFVDMAFFKDLAFFEDLAFSEDLVGVCEFVRVCAGSFVGVSKRVWVCIQTIKLLNSLYSLVFNWP